jgi:hypothetical protein
LQEQLDAARQEANALRKERNAALELAGEAENAPATDLGSYKPPRGPGER